MVDRFSGRLNTVVTANAIACYGRVIHERNYAPVSGDVTVGAFAGRDHVICRFRSRAHKSAVGMTARARGIGRAKSCADVTSFASDAGMRSIEYEAGAEMVEGLLR